jgi:AbrB family looped-hinge helix DNA binding protein
MSRTKVTGKGQVTIPKEIRDYLKLKTGDEVFFVIDDRRHRVTLWAKNGDIRDMAGILKDVVPKRRQPVTIEEMNDAILREHSRERAKKR